MALAELAGYGRLSVLYSLVVGRGGCGFLCRVPAHPWPATAGHDVVSARRLGDLERHYALPGVAPHHAVVASGGRCGPPCHRRCWACACTSRWGLGDPDRRVEGPLAPAEAVTTKAQAPVRVNELGEAVTRDSRRPDQGIREEALAGPTALGTKSEGDPDANSEDDLTEELITKRVGRRKLATQLGISEPSARQPRAQPDRRLHTT
jgi:hypothetical protein